MIKRTIAVPTSGNAKLGPGWGCTYRPVGPTCPSSCPLLGNGCYAQRGRVALFQRRAGSATAELGHLDGCARVRWEVSGDALWRGRLDRAYHRAKLAWHARNPGSISLGYTHAPGAFEQAGYGPGTWPDGFHLLASVHDLVTAREWQSRGWRTARVIQGPEERARGERLCPFDADKHAGRPQRTDCARCGLCFRSR